MNRRTQKPRTTESPGRHRMIKATMLTTVILTAMEYARNTFDHVIHAQVIATQIEEKPYVYRALIPGLAHLLVILGVRADIALTILVVCSAIGLLYAILYLIRSVRQRSS